MNYNRLKNAFGSTPESIKDCVARSLREEQRREPVVKKKMSVSMAIALAVVLIISCVGFAASQTDGIAGFFSLTDPKTGEVIVNEPAVANIQSLYESYEGNAVRCILTEAMLDAEHGRVALGWQLHKREQNDDQYYVLCNQQVGGSWIERASLRSATEIILKDSASCAISGDLTGEGYDAELKFTILKINGEIVRYTYDDEDENVTETRREYLRRLNAEGKLPMAGDGMIEAAGDPDTTYAQDLVATGLMEIVDEFTIRADLSAIQPVSKKRVYEGETSFDFDGYSVNIVRCEANPMGVYLDIEYITDEMPLLDEYGYAQLYMHGQVPGVEYWYSRCDPVYEKPVQMEDGRFLTRISLPFGGLKVYPEELTLTIGLYDENMILTYLDDAISLKLTDK